MNELIACLQAASATVQRVAHENRLVNRYTARDFTPFRFMSGWGEVAATHLLAFFLDPDEDHGQGTLFQEHFIKRLRQFPLLAVRLPDTHWQVEAERRHSGYGQLDLLLTSADHTFGICIENKPRAQTADQYKQLTSYRKLLRARHQENYLLIYLSHAPRKPAPSSLTKKKRKRLYSSGHYLNLTYCNFIFDLLDDWHQAVHPENLRIFLRQFRHHIESWLQYDSTKPAQLMQEQEVATTLAASAANVRAAFEINAAFGAMRQQLLVRLTQGLLQQVPGLIGAPHWSYSGFFEATTYRPFLIHRPSPTGLPESLPWGRYAIVLEFKDGKLLYGVRYGRIDWHSEDKVQGTEWPAEIADCLSPVPLAERPRRNEWWPWEALAGPTTDRELYPAIANAESDLWRRLKLEIVRLTIALDSWHKLSVLSAQLP